MHASRSPVQAGSRCEVKVAVSQGASTDRTKLPEHAAAEFVDATQSLFPSDTSALISIPNIVLRELREAAQSWLFELTSISTLQAGSPLHENVDHHASRVRAAIKARFSSPRPESVLLDKLLAALSVTDEAQRAMLKPDRWEEPPLPQEPVACAMRFPMLLMAYAWTAERCDFVLRLQAQAKSGGGAAKPQVAAQVPCQDRRDQALRLLPRRVPVPQRAAGAGPIPPAASVRWPSFSRSLYPAALAQVRSFDVHRLGHAATAQQALLYATRLFPNSTVLCCESKERLRDELWLRGK
jgi:hypothetical protein